MINLSSFIRVGANAAKKIETANFSGIRQILGGKTVVQGHIGKWGDRYTAYTSITSGNKTVSRTIPKRLGENGDLTKIITRDIAKAGNKEVRTFNREEFAYTREGNVFHTNETIDNVFAGRKLLGTRNVISNDNPGTNSIYHTLTKTFKDAQGNILKTVYYNPMTGKRTGACLPDGSRLSYNEKGLPEFTDNYGGKMDLGGLEALF